MSLPASQTKTYDKVVVRVVLKDESERYRLTSARNERHRAERHENIWADVLNLQNKTLKMKNINMMLSELWKIVILKHQQTHLR